VVKQVKISFARWEALAVMFSRLHEVYMTDAYRKLCQDLYNYQQQAMHSYLLSRFDHLGHLVAEA